MNTINSDRKSFFLFSDRLQALDHPFDDEFLIDQVVSLDRSKMTLFERVELFEKTFPEYKEKILRAYFDQAYGEILVQLEDLKHAFSSLGAIYHKELCSIAIEKIQAKNYKNLDSLLEDICHSQEFVASYIREFLDQKNK